MAKIYYRKYHERIKSGEITLEQALLLVETEVPERWRNQVKEMLLENHGND